MGRKRLAPIVGLMMMIMCWGKSEAKESVKYKDPKAGVEERVKDLLKRMTLPEKIGQMTQIERTNCTADIIKNNFIGSLLSGGGSVPAPKASPGAWVKMIKEFQKGALATRLGIPMIYGIDAVHGHNNVYKSTIFPHNIGLGVTRDPDLAKRIGAATALEVRATGIPYAFAPCIAVCRDPRWGRCYESYSEDHEIVQMMSDIIPGLQGDVPSGWTSGVPYVNGKDNKVAACAKHYVGDGGTNKGIDENNTITSMDNIYKIHMPAYLNSMKKGVATVMASYSSINGKKMHANEELLTGYLKGKLNFKGFIISDWQGIDRITATPHDNYTYSIEASINAGIDMVMVPYNYTEFIDGLTKLVKAKAVPMSRIDDAVSRILRVKFAMGLFENPLPDESLENKLGCKEHREIAREAVRKSMVLLKNGKDKEPMLPLPKESGKFLVAGTHADNLGYQCGGWTIQWQGLSGNNLTKGTTILDAIKATVDPKTKVVHEENPSEKELKSDHYSYAIVVVGEVPYAEMNGDSNNLTIPHPGPSIIENVCKALKCVVVIISGRPVVIEKYVPKMNALVAAWLPGTEGQGVADVLFGDYGFTGKLARTWFKTVDQLPMNYGDKKYDPLFPFGFGLETKAKKQCAASAKQQCTA
ncbi:Glycosyl hydrolase family protein [Euphorbia peplus]|nr:Glycosyl hydrolase family protein [Euphorbia peplus]